MKAYLLSLFLFCTVASLKAQTIKGQVTEAKTGHALSFATLSLTGQSEITDIYHTNCDSTGNFIFSKLSPGTYTLVAGMVGYQKTSIQVALSPNQSLDVGKLVMTEDINLLNTVTINGGTPNFSSKNGQLKIVVATNPYFKASTSMSEVLRKLPGLQVSQEGVMLFASGATPTIFIDGKPVNMNAEEVQSYISGLSPENVESIELITNPSARYDGHYQGIIDIRIKRSSSLGLKGNYSLRYQKYQRGMAENSLLLNYKTKKFAYALSTTAANGSTYYRYYALQLLQNSNALETDTRTIARNNNYNIQASVSFEVSKSQELTAYIRTFQLERNALTGNQLTTTNGQQTVLISQNIGETSAMPTQQNYAGGISYDLKRGNGQLQLLATAAQIDNRQPEDIRYGVQPGLPPSSYWKTRSSNAITIQTIQGDYTHKIGKTTIELGGKFALSNTENNLRYDTLYNGQFYLDPSRSNQFSYREQVSAGYAAIGSSLGKISYNLAMRTEHTSTLASSATDNSLTERNYFKWLPSASLNYQLSKASALNLAYSNKLTRPGFQALNPFRFYYSARHYWIGNPMLQPSTTQQVSLTFSNPILNISFNGGREKQPMSRYPEYDNETNVLIFKGDNLPYRDFLNLQASIPLKLTPWWRINHNLNVFYNKEIRPYLGRIFQLPIYNYTINGSQIFTLKKLTIDLSYSLESKSGNGIYIFAPVRTLDLGFQRSWIKRRLTGKLQAQDIFDGGKRRIIFREKAIMNNDFYHYNATRRLIFAISYSFGSSNHQQKELKKSDEENRVGG